MSTSQFHSESSYRQAKPTVARFLLNGNPRPRIENALRVGEALRRAALAQFGWDEDPKTGRRIPRAPKLVSGRDEFNRPLKDPAHWHAFWIPDDADLDGEIDHLTVYARGGIDAVVRQGFERLTRLWLPEWRPRPDWFDDNSIGIEERQEWRLALEGFGDPEDFAPTAPMLRRGTVWCSVTPFLASGHLKRGRYQPEVRRLLKLRGGRLAAMAGEINVQEEEALQVNGTNRSASQFIRSRSRIGERQHDTSGAMLRLTFPDEVEGPLTLGYACHFGLGSFRVVEA